jgi:choline kinase
MNIIILGDRYKKGMKSKGCVGLIKINNTTNIFQKQYNQIKSFFPDSRIIYISGFESKKFSSFLKKHDKNQEVIHLENDLFAKTNSGFSLNLAREYLDTNCLVIDGSTNISDSLLKNIKTTQDKNLVCIGNKSGDIGCILNNSRVDSLNIDIDNRIYDVFYVTQHTALRLQDIIEHNYHNAFLFEIINILIDLGEHFYHKTFNKPQLCYH